MRRLLPLLLLAVPALCWAAASDDEMAPKNGACVYTRASAPASAAEADSAQARTPVPPVARSVPRTTASGGGGNDGDAVMQRTRSPRWHSFLPGMFR